MGLRIVGTGMSVSDTIETAEELSNRVGRSPEWIVRRTGVAERRVATEPAHVYGARAARQALGEEPPDLVINASLTPHQLIPDSSVFLMRELGFEGIPSFTVHATCLSFLVAMVHSVEPLLRAGAYRRILVVSSEIGTISRDEAHPESAVLIGDGAAAAVFEWDTRRGLIAHRMRTLPSGAELAEIPGCGMRFPPESPDTPPGTTRFSMNGPRIYRLAAAHLQSAMDETLDAAGLTLDQVDVCVPHQASGPALGLMRKVGVAGGRIVDIVGSYGNCIAASLPMALHVGIQRGQVQRGDSMLMLGTGAGLHCAAAILEY